uniref:CTLH domain-containing protein n=1 Tax=Anopheles culicifacies TaxID=139723 RepID=A0A182MLD8_9DIPT
MSEQPNNKVPSLAEWTKSLQQFPLQQEYINKLIVNYFVRAGYKEAAEAFMQESNAKPTIDLQSLDTRAQIVELIRNGNALEAAHLIEKFFPGVLGADHLLKFQLLRLHVIELIRTGCLEGALLFAQTLPFDGAEHTPEMRDEIERTLMLLIFEYPLTCPFGALLEQSHRDKVARTFSETVLKRTNDRLPLAEVDHLFKLVLWCQEELTKGKVQFIKMKNIATALLELE